MTGLVLGTFTINKATPAPLNGPTGTAITYGDPLAASKLSSSDPGTWAWSNGNARPTVAANSFTATFTPSDANNYNWTGVTLTKTVTIPVNKAELTVKAEDKTIALGAVQPSYSFTVSGLKGSDTKAVVSGVTYSLNPDFDSSVEGTAVITPSGGTADNYNLSYASGTLTVTTCLHASSETVTTTEPTCVDEGISTTRCTDTCKAVISTAPVDPLGHSFTRYTGDTATCTAEGVETAICGREGCSEVHVRDTLKKDHSWDAGTVTTRPTATKAGVRTFACTVCQATKTESIPATGNDDRDDGNTGGTTPKPPVTEIPVESDNGTGASGDAIAVSVTIDGGKVKVIMDDKKIAEIIAQATASGGSEKAPGVTIDLSRVEGAETAELPAAAITALAEKAIAVTVKLPEAEVTLSAEAMAILADSKGGAVTVEVRSVQQSELSELQAAAVRGLGIVINVDIYAGRSKIDVPISISIPYTLKPNERAGGVCLWHLNEDGTLTLMEASYNPSTGMLTAFIPHQSYFVLGYSAHICDDFTDIANHWGFEHICWSIENGVMAGDGKGRFDPNGTMTRAMFAQVLYNMEGQPGTDIDNPFDDVAGQWYKSAVLWAYEKGIVQGVGSGSFDPERKITRQEMAAMLHAYAGFKGYSIPENRPYQNFADQDLIGAWAETEVKKLFEAGVFSGKPGNLFDPTGQATRAEAATMLRQFAENVAGK